jgi:hypothetical protein
VNGIEEFLPEEHEDAKDTKGVVRAVKFVGGAGVLTGKVEAVATFQRLHNGAVWLIIHYL